MGRLAQAVKQGAPRTGHWCYIDEWIETLDPEERDEVRTLMRDFDHWRAKAIVDVIRDQLGKTLGRQDMDKCRKSRTNG